MRLLKRQTYHKSLWKNKGGETHDIVSFPQSLSGPDSSFDWRISLADVSSNGPYSTFPEYDRILTQASTQGSRLAFEDGRVITTEFAKPVYFSGNEIIDASLISQDAKNFNVMVRRGVFEGSVACQFISSEWFDVSKDKADVLLLCNLSDALITSHTSGERVYCLEQYDCLMMDEASGSGDEELVSVASENDQGVLAIVRLHRCF